MFKKFGIKYIFLTFLYTNLLFAAENKSEDNLSAKDKNVLSYIFLDQNPIFKDQKHMVSLHYGYSINNNKNISNVFFSYSVPTVLFMNGRTSLEVGAILGNAYYIDPNTATLSYPNINQAIGGILHEFVMNLKYFYVAAGIGLYVRSANSEYLKGDTIGSIVVFGPKLAIGKAFGKYNVELEYRHFSNGYLERPNSGYNFVGVSLGMRL